MKSTYTSNTTVNLIKEFAINFGIQTLEVKHNNKDCVAIVVETNPFTAMIAFGTYLSIAVPNYKVQKGIMNRMHDAFYDASKNLIIFPEIWNID